MNKLNRNILIIGSLIFLVLCAAYSNHFYNGFHFDDWHTIEENPFIRNIKNIPAYFSDPKMFSVLPSNQSLRPIVTTSLAIDYWLGGGLNPFYFHLSTFIWFIVLGILIFFSYKIILNKAINHHYTSYFAILATGWYMLNTANAETINYVISRSDVLSTLFIVASFYIYIAWPAKRKWFLYIIPAVIGVFTKETVLVLIIILFFYIILFEKNLTISNLFKANNFKFILQTISSLIPLILIVGIAQVYTLTRISGMDGISNPLFSYLITQTYVWLHYFISFFLPLNLSADTDWKVFTNLFDERIIIGFAFIIALLISIFKLSDKKETKPITFGLIWFSAALLPTSIAPFAEVTNDHRMFFPFIGLALSVVTSIGLFILKHEPKIKANSFYRFGISLVCLIVLSLNAFGVYQRNKIWNNEESLWYDVTIKSPLNGRGFMNYGLALMEKGDYESALTTFEKALPLSPNYSSLYINLGIVKNRLNRTEEAEKNFKRAIELAPDKFNPYIYYAKFLDQNNRTTESISMAEKANSFGDNAPIVINFLMQLYNQTSQWDKLSNISKQMLQISPNDEMAAAYLNAAKSQTPYFNTANKSTIKTVSDYINLSLELYNSGKYLECINACNEALKLKPNSTEAYNNIGAAYNKLKEWKKGIEACQKALDIDPNNKLALGNMAWAKEELEKLNN
ncbi:tetratricopeptide repeat protein [Pedobacter alpinus]|uniref:Tetratricopeptide repeat protein n=1 Tax=Pedobacter alpinus TaxID=1590643 RepID=A0ABW5TMZ1_9SPHI